MDKEKTVVEYNNKSDFQKKYTYGQKANGELQLKEVTLRSDIAEGLLDEGLDSIENFFKMCRKRGLKVVSPYVIGREPDV